MAKITLVDIGSGFNLSKINDNFDKIETELNDKVLYRADTGTEPNEWQDTQDANSNRLINLPDAINPTEPVTLGQYNANAVGSKTTQTLKQKHTATAGQTVFATPAYVIGSNNLSVYINGVRQDGAAYSETTTTSITLSEGAELNDIVEVLVNELQETVGTVGANSVTYNSSTVGSELDTLTANKHILQDKDISSRWICGSIRNNGTKATNFEYWKVIDYSGHAPQGFKNIVGDHSDVVETDTSKIRVHHNIGGNITGGVVAVLDETLAQTGLRLGTSVGELFTDIYLYRDIWGLLQKTGGAWNVLYDNGIDSAVWNASGYLDITHKECPNFSAILNMQGSGSAGEWQAQATQVTSTTSRIYFVRTKPLYHSARIRSNGTSFSVVGSSENITLGSWSGGLLSVTFDSGDVNTFDIQVSAGGGTTGIGYRTEIRNPSSTGCDIQFIDSAGARVTAQDTKMEVFIRARSRTQSSEPPDGTNFAVRFNSRSQINPQLLDAVEYPAGNIWIMGTTVEQ